MLRMPAILGLALLLSLMAAEAGARCLQFQPATVTLSGTLTERVVPGPPSYRSIAHADIPETVLFLELDKPLCVIGDPMMLRNTLTVAGIEEVQVRPSEYWRRSLVGKHVKISGGLFTAHSLAHRTRVVLDATAMRASKD